MTDLTKLNITNGHIAWFDCSIEDGRVFFGARVNKGVIQKTHGTIAVAENMRVMNRQDAVSTMLKAVAASKQPPVELSAVFGCPASDMTDLAMLVRNREMVPGTRFTDGTFVTRSNRSVRVDPKLLSTPRA